MREHPDHLAVMNFAFNDLVRYLAMNPIAILTVSRPIPALADNQ